MQIIRKNKEMKVKISGLERGDTFRVGDLIYMLYRKSNTDCSCVCLLNGRSTKFYLGFEVIPVNTTLICEDITIEMKREKEELEGYCKCNCCNQ